MHSPDLLPLSIFLFAGLVLTLLFIAWSVIYRVHHPQRLTAGTAAARGWWIDPTDAGLEFDDWILEPDAAVKLPVWEIDHPQNLEGPVLIITHGWGESRIAALQRVPCLLPHFSRVVLWDLPGHGDAPENSRSRLGAVEAEHLRNLITRSAEGRRTILYGWGMGARIAMAEAVTNPLVIGTIIEKPAQDFWCEINQVLRTLRIPMFPVGSIVGFLTRRFNRGLSEHDLTVKAGRLRRPLLVFPAAVAGSRVEKIAREVADAAATSEFIEFNRTELVDLMTEGDPSLERTIRDFVHTCIARSNLDQRPHTPAS